MFLSKCCSSRITRAFSNSFKKKSLLLPSYAKEASTVLPEGRESRNFECDISVRVTDSYGASSDASTTVAVRPYVPATTDRLEDASNLLSDVTADGNDQKTLQMVNALAASVNSGASSSGQSFNNEIQTRALLVDYLLNATVSVQDKHVLVDTSSPERCP